MNQLLVMSVIITRSQQETRVCHAEQDSIVTPRESLTKLLIAPEANTALRDHQLELNVLMAHSIINIMPRVQVIVNHVYLENTVLLLDLLNQQEIANKDISAFLELALLHR